MCHKKQSVNKNEIILSQTLSYSIFRAVIKNVSIGKYIINEHKHLITRTYYLNTNRGNNEHLKLEINFSWEIKIFEAFVIRKALDNLILLGKKEEAESYKLYDPR